MHTLRIAIALLLLAALLTSGAAAQQGLSTPQTYDGPSLSQPTQVNMIYNNQMKTGYMIQSNNEVYVSVDSIKSLFNFNDTLDTTDGRYLVNGRAIDTYYFWNRMYLDLADFCGAVGLMPKITTAGIVFLSLHQSDAGTYQAPQSSVSLQIKGRASGNCPDPVNNMAYIFEVGMTNTTRQMIVLNHFNFILVGSSGQKYVSIKQMSYGVVYGGNDTPDSVFLDPGNQHVLNLTFDLPATDSPQRLIILQNQQVIGSVDA